MTNSQLKALVGKSVKEAVSIVQGHGLGAWVLGRDDFVASITIPLQMVQVRAHDGVVVSAETQASIDSRYS
jgi:hypothetical protein